MHYLIMGNLNEIQINQIVELIRKKWTLDIVKNIFFEINTFNEILKKNDKLSNKVLSQRLKELEEDEIIEKVIISKTPLQTQYHLTQKGKDLNQILNEINNFGHKYYKLDCGECSKTSEILELD